jgi:hypothetical protein
MFWQIEQQYRKYLTKNLPSLTRMHNLPSGIGKSVGPRGKVQTALDTKMLCGPLESTECSFDF